MMEKQIRIAVAGAQGRMGQEVVKMLGEDQELVYTGALDTRVSDEVIERQLAEMKPAWRGSMGAFHIPDSLFLLLALQLLGFKRLLVFRFRERMLLFLV